MSRPTTDRRSERGRTGEDAALRVYEGRGFALVARNWRCPLGELDLVVVRRDLLVFCEVKSKSGDRLGDPLEMVTTEKQRRLRRAAEAWLALHPDLYGLEMSWGVIAVRDGRLQRVRNAFA